MVGEVAAGPSPAALDEDVREPEPAAGSLLAPERLGIWAWVLGYTAILTTLSVLRYDLWLATGFDLGLYEQGLWLIWHEGLRAVSSFTGHPLLVFQAAYLLIPLALLYHLGGTGALLALQAFSLGLGYVLIRRIGQTLGIGDRTCHLVGMIYLLYPVVLGSNLFDFHPVTLAVPLLLGAIHAALRQRPLASAIYVALALLTADVLVVPVLLLGLALVLQGRMRPGLAAVGVGLGVGLLDGLVVLPHLGGPPASLSALLGVAGIATQSPWLAWVHDLRAWEYLVWLAGPALGLLLAGWRGLWNAWWLPALAVVAINLGSGSIAATSPFNQLSLPAVPFVVLGLLAALRLRRAAPPRWLVFAPALAFLAVFGWHQLRTNWHALPHNITQLATEAAAVPPLAPVVAQNFALPQLANRAVALLPGALTRHPLPAGSYVLLQPGTSTGTTPPALVRMLEQALSRKGVAVTLYAKGGVMLARTRKPIQLKVGSP